MKRRLFLNTAAAAAMIAPSALRSAQPDIWGGDQGFPSGWSGGSLMRDTTRRVGNYSGGFEAMLPHRSIRAAGPVLALTEGARPLRYQWRAETRTPEDYLANWPVTGLLILRGGNIWYESYRFARTPQMRFTSWSMAKSVTSLLLGICIDRGLVHSLDDTAQSYVPELEGTLHGGCTLRNLSNMSSGAEVDHERDNGVIFPAAFTDGRSSIRRTVAGWNQRREEQGQTFNYNELCALTVGMVIRQVTGRSLSAFAQDALWQPLGAEGDATWTTDSEHDEFNCIGFAARLRDWGRLGTLIAERGRANGRQIISERWIGECTSWGPSDRQVRYGAIRPDGVLAGYKAFMWHAKPDGSQLAFNGFHGQRVFVDLPTGTVLVQTAIDHAGLWQQELYALFSRVVALPA